jgi:hypothetical protein
MDLHTVAGQCPNNLLWRIGRFFEMGKDKEVWLLAYVPNYSSKTF